MKKETLTSIADILGNGYKCYLNTATEEVFAADQIDVETRNGSHFKEYVPLDATLFFTLMQNFIQTVDDFEKQSELMEAIGYEQPFQSFKRKVYAQHLADDWIAYRSARIVDMLEKGDIS